MVSTGLPGGGMPW